MNVIKVKVLFEKGICSKEGISVVSGDYNSTKMEFTFDKEEGIKVLEIAKSDGTLVYTGEIVNNEVVLAREEDGGYYSLFDEEKDYVYEVSLYDGDSKLTSATDYLTVRKEQIKIGDELVEPYLPIFDELLSDVSEAIESVEAIDIDAEKEGNKTTVTITNHAGETKSVEVLDGTNGVDGRDGTDGKDAKINGVNTANIVAGENISINQEGNTLTVSAVGGGATYTAGENITIEDNVISAVDTIYDDTQVKSDITSLQNNKADKSEIPDVSNFITKSVNDLTYYTLATNTGSTIELEINSSTYVMTLNLKNSAGTTISTDTIDLPLESVVVNGSYDSTNKKIILTLQNGNTIDVPVGDLVSGLQTELSSNNKLNADYIDDSNSTNKLTNATEKSAWSGKYDKPSGGIPASDLSNAVQTSLGKADTALQSETYTGTITSVKMNGTTIASSGEADLGTVITDISGKQDTLVSGTNIKTINSNSILGEGNITTETIQYSTMPTASVDNLGKIVQYTGTTTTTAPIYTNGHFYKCVSDGAVTPTYSWEEVSFGGNTSPSSCVFVESKSSNTWCDNANDKQYKVLIDILNAKLKNNEILNYWFDGYDKGGRVSNVYYNTSQSNYAMMTIYFDNDCNVLLNGRTVSSYGVSYIHKNYSLLIYIPITEYNAQNIQHIYSNSNLTSVTFTLANDVNCFILSDKTQIVGINNNTAWTPTKNYGVVHKKYVDDNCNPTVTTSSTTTYTIASLTGNNVYKLGEITALTISAVTTFDKESVIYFESGSTATTVSIPATLTNIGDVPTLTTASSVSTGTCTASSNYIISVLNGIAVWKEY